ncbi:MAG: glycosyltransferase [Bacteroidetes bacterium]|nr:glycosyltransferase [Bacteroidota bacterium]
MLRNEASQEASQEFLSRKFGIQEDNPQPSISILIAARNEESNILKCLEAINKLNYPKGKFDVWVGDDSSTDSTAKIIEDFCLSQSNFYFLRVKENLGNARGKANVLAQLAHKAKGEYYFLTDADIEVQQNWVGSLLPLLEGKIQMAGGTTIIKAGETFASLQNLESIFLYAVFHAASSMKDVTVSGNNLAFNATIYKQIGGFEAIPFSITEDYALLKEFQKLGYGYKHQLSSESLVFSAPLVNFKSLLQQRRRWIGGASSTISADIWIALGVYGLFLPIWLVLFYFQPATAITILTIKTVLDFLIISRTSTRLRLRPNYFLFPLFEGFLLGLNFILFFYCIIPGGVVWKGRKY